MLRPAQAVHPGRDPGSANGLVMGGMNKGENR